MYSARIFPSIPGLRAYTSWMTPQRIDAIDTLRGLAMVWMTLFHFSFDLNHAGVWPQDFYTDPWWTWQRSCIVSLFLFCAGFSQALVVAQGQTLQRFMRRWLQVAGCALLVSLGSWWMFPQSWIYFGILHGMAVMLLLVRMTMAWGQYLWLAGLLAVASKFFVAWLLVRWGSADVLAWMNAPVLNCLGWITQKPITEDYVPVFPWLGVMWWGAASGMWLAKPARLSWLACLPAWRPLVLLGRWSLSYYMLHQPVLIGLVTLGVWLRANALFGA